MIDLQEVHTSKFRRQPPPHCVVTGAQNKDLGRARANSIPHLALTKRLSVAKGLKLPWQHPVKRLIDGNHPSGTGPPNRSGASYAGSNEQFRCGLDNPGWENCVHSRFRSQGNNIQSDLACGFTWFVLAHGISFETRSRLIRSSSCAPSHNCPVA